MNQRDKLYVQRELIAWANWVKQGRTFPGSAIGYKSTTVEYAIMRGETGGSGISGPKVPTKFNTDRNVETVDRVFSDMPKYEQDAISGVYLYQMPERRIALIVGATRHLIRVRLYAGYVAVYEALTTNR